MALRDITAQLVPVRADEDDRQWCPQYMETEHKFVANDQQADESLMEYYERNGVTEGRINSDDGNYIEFRDCLVIGVTDITRDLVVVIGCPTAAILVRLDSHHGRDDATASNATRFRANDGAVHEVAGIYDMLQECREIGHFTDPTQIQSVLIGQFDWANSGRIEQSVTKIVKEGLEDMDLHPMEYQYHESAGDINERKGLGTVLVLAPAITGAPMPHIIIDDELEFSLTP